MAPSDPERFEQVEAGLEALFDKIVDGPRRVLRTYGMIDYGDLICSHSNPADAVWAAFRDDPDVVDRMKYNGRSYNNEANDQLNALWGFFVHTGQRRHFLAAEAYSEHMADVDIVHASLDRSATGLIHYHNAHHWTGGYSPSHTCLAGLMQHYYLTGNRRILDVCREVADWVLSHQEPCGIFSNNGPLVREYTTPLANLLEFYQATWEHRYGDLARRSLRWLLLAQPEPGSFPLSIYTSGERGDEAEVEQCAWHLQQPGGMTPQLLYDALQIFGDGEPLYRETLLGLAHQYVRGLEPSTQGFLAPLVVLGEGVKRVDPMYNAPLIAYAYELTDDLTCAAYCRHYLREHFPPYVEELGQRWGFFNNVCWGSIIPPLMEAVRRAEARHGVEALDRAEEAWIQEMGDAAPPDPELLPGRVRPPRRSLGAICGYDV
jgi:hypothetical protein